MSIHFLSNNDSFLRWGFPDELQGRYPVTLAIWVKEVPGALNNQILCSVGQRHSNCCRFENRQSERQMSAFNDATVDDFAFSALQAFPQDTWVFTALRADATPTFDLYTSEYNGTPNIVQGSGTATEWLFGEWLRGVAVGSRDIQLAGGHAVMSNFKVAYMGLWDRKLSDLELDSLKDGAAPETITTNLLGSWLTVADSLVESLDDTSGNAGALTIYDAATAIANGGAYPPVYDGVDTPPVTHPATVNKARITLVDNITGLPYANKVSLQYRATEGVDSENQTLAYAGVTSSADNGEVVIDTPSHNANDVLQFTVWDPLLGTINDETAIVGSGPIVVSGSTVM